MKKTDWKDYARKIAFAGMVLFTILLTVCVTLGKYNVLAVTSVVLYATCNLVHVFYTKDVSDKVLAYLAWEIVQPIPLFIIFLVDAVLK